MPRVLLVFVDGVGLGDDDPAANPFVAGSLPVLGALLDGAAITRHAAPHHAARASLVGIDATLGVSGTPQSGTGQASLLTGVNAAVMHGSHFGPWVPAQFRRRVREESLLAQAKHAGWRVAFANAYPEEVLRLDAAWQARGADAVPEARVEAGPKVRGEAAQRAGTSAPDAASIAGEPEEVDGEAVAAGTAAVAAAARDRRRLRRGTAFLRAGPPLAALGAGVLNRHLPELHRGDAVASEITNDGWRDTLGHATLPVIDAAAAGRNLAELASGHHLTLFAHYATDSAGHRRSMAAARHALERLDAFLGGILERMPGDMLLFVVSDHGNIEDVQCGHTRNPALGMVAGAGHPLIARRLGDLTDVTPTILDVLSIR